MGVKRSSTAKGLLLGVFFPPKVLKAKNTFGKIIQKHTEHDDIDGSRSYG
jgi:hypothetical protein